VTFKDHSIVSKFNIYANISKQHETRGSVVGCLGLALDSRLDGRGFSSRPQRHMLRWVTVFDRANHLSSSRSHPSQLSLLPSAGREMSTSQSAALGYALRLGVAGLVHSTCELWVAGKTV